MHLPDTLDNNNNNGPEFSKVYYLQIKWLFKSVDYNKREISVIQRVQ